MRIRYIIKKPLFIYFILMLVYYNFQIKRLFCLDNVNICVADIICYMTYNVFLFHGILSLIIVYLSIKNDFSSTYIIRFKSKMNWCQSIIKKIIKMVFFMTSFQIALVFVYSKIYNIVFDTNWSDEKSYAFFLTKYINYNPPNYFEILIYCYTSLFATTVILLFIFLIILLLSDKSFLGFTVCVILLGTYALDIKSKINILNSMMPDIYDIYIGEYSFINNLMIIIMYLLLLSIIKCTIIKNKDFIT